MCIAKEIVENLIKLIDQIEIENKILANQQAISNKEEQIVLHRLENFNFNACEGYHIAKQLQDIRVKRRKIKDETASLDSLNSNANFFKELKKQLQYKFKTLDNIEENRGKKYHSKISKNLIVKDNLEKLKSVNQTNISFHNEQDHIEGLLKQVN